MHSLVFAKIIQIARKKQLIVKKRQWKIAESIKNWDFFVFSFAKLLLWNYLQCVTVLRTKVGGSCYETQRISQGLSYDGCFRSSFPGESRFCRNGSAQKEPYFL
jgi:hypothetical protein